MAQEGYAHPELLVETAWLVEHLNDPGIRIVDCDAPDAYNRAHISGAVNIGQNGYIKGEDGVHVMPPEQVAEFLGKLGIGDDTLVVAYDGRNAVSAARLWWVLSYYGHTQAKVLNGGWRKWLAEGRPVTDRATSVAPATFTPRPDESLVVKGEELKAAIGSKDGVIWDVRSAGEYTGEAIRNNKYGGHIPGAVHLEWTNVMDTEGLSTFKPAAEVRHMLREQGITPDKQVYTH